MVVDIGGRGGGGGAVVDAVVGVQTHARRREVLEEAMHELQIAQIQDVHVHDAEEGVHVGDGHHIRRQRCVSLCV